MDIPPGTVPEIHWPLPNSIGLSKLRLDTQYLQDPQRIPPAHRISHGPSKHRTWMQLSTTAPAALLQGISGD